MQLEVYESDADVMEAAATLAQEALATSTKPTVAVAIAGGRPGRALMAALAARDALPWVRLRLCVADETATHGPREQSNRQLLAEQVLGPRGVPMTDPRGDAFETFEADVAAAVGPEGAFDLVVLVLGPEGSLGALAPGSPRLAEAGADVVRHGAERIGLGPGAFGRAGRIIVVVVGGECQDALARAMGTDTAALPARLVLPSSRVTWLVDRAAAAVLLRDATVVRA